METNLKKELIFEESSMEDKSISILLVEDNPGDVVIIRELLNSSGIDFSLKQVSTLKETILLCVEMEYDIILLDLGLPDSIGLETLKKIQVFNVKSPVIVMTGLDDEDIALEALREGAQDYLVKSRLTSDNIIRGIKYGIERKKISDLLRKNAKQFSLLSSTATAINESEDIASIYAVTCRNISNLFEKTGCVVIDFGENGKVYASGTEHLEPWHELIRSTIGLNLGNPLNYFIDKRSGIASLFNDGKLHKIHVKAQDGGVLDHDNSALKGRRKPSFLNMYAMGFIKKGDIYGGILIFCPNIITTDNLTIIETVGNQVSLSLHRRAIELDLKSSESRYRKLSKELEIKVKERTRDLEQSNYQLNQELIERHQAEEALIISETRLKELNATKDKFFNIIAHDLKNPFTCLLGSTEILLEKISQMDPEKVKELAQILNDSAKSGYAILQNLLDWSRSQTGMIVLNPETINLKSLIEENIADLKLSTTKKNVRIISRVHEDMYIVADKNMLNAVLRNLLGNALKFTHSSGSVSVKASQTANEVTVSVKDTGIGIPGSKIGELFRIDTKYTRPGTGMEQGTGLGLKICKEFVEMQGGTIWVESTVNEGSEFLFTIPVR